MKDKNYGEFDNFDDFFDDLLKHLSETEESENGEITYHIDDLDAQRCIIKEVGSKKEIIKDAELEAEDEDKKKLEQYNSEHQNHKQCDSSLAEKRKKTAGKSIPFFVILFAITIIAWSLPLRPTVSISEKRNLEEFPDYSLSALVSGEYFKSIDKWFSDSFTFREAWISLANRINSLYGIRSVAVYGEVPIADPIPIPSVASTFEGLLDNNESETNDLLLSSTDIQTDESLVSDVFGDFDSFGQGTESDGEGWGGIVIDQDEIIADKGAKLQIGDSIFVYPGFNQHYAGEYAKRVNRLAELIKDKVNLYCLLVPENATSMLTRSDREKYGFVIEEDAFDYIYSLMGESIKTVNVISNLQRHNNEYIVFRSDHHWTALGAYYAYEEWCRIAGKELVSLSEYKTIAWEGFFGTYYYTAGQPKEITNNPDTVFAYEPPGDVHLYLDFRNSYKLGTETDLLLDRSTIKVDQYITFLGTDNAKATFINNDIDDDSAVLVLKDSFGNPFVYYLTQHYHYVYVVDYRYFNYSISRFIENNKVDDVIIINLANLMYSESGLNAVTRLYK